jgi:hypothetical protein
VEHRGRTLYPGFQFDPDEGRPRAGVEIALERLPAGMRGWALALWFDTPTDVDGRWVAPVDLLADEDLIAAVADRERAAWERDGAA